MSKCKTTEEVNAEYKSRAPKFDEKIHQGDTEDWLALSAKRKPFTVGLPPNFIILSDPSEAVEMLYFIYALYNCCTVLVLCLYYAL